MPLAARLALDRLDGWAGSLSLARPVRGRQRAIRSRTTHPRKLALSGITDLSTLDYVSRLLGDAEVDRTTITAQAGGGTSTSTSTQQQRLAPADALRQLRLGEGVLVYGALPAARLRLRRADRGALAVRRTPGDS